MEIYVTASSVNQQNTLHSLSRLICGGDRDKTRFAQIFQIKISGKMMDKVESNTFVGLSGGEWG